jgi:tetratricopeptide (TPR) repeat protein
VEAARAYARGLVRYRAGDLPQARDALTEALRLDGAHAASHLLLARTWKGMGYFQKARDEAERALQLLDGLAREDQLSIEVSARDVRAEWDRAVEVERALVTFFPDRIVEWLRLIGVQSRARRGKDCSATIEALHQRPLPDPEDPNIDLTEAWCYQVVPDFPRSLASAERAVRRAERRGASLLAANGRLVAGYALTRIGQADHAIEQYREAEKTFHGLGDRGSEARVLNGLGIVYNERKDRVHAQPLLRQAITLQREVGNRAGEMMALNNLANTLDPREARPLYQRVAALADEVHDRLGAVLAMTNLARLDAFGGDVAQARRGLEQARDLAHAGGDRYGESLALVQLCEIVPRTGDLAAAEKACDDTERLWAQIGEKTRRTELIIARAVLRINQGRFADADGLAHQAIDDARAAAVADYEIEAQYTRAEALWRQGRRREAGAALARAQQLVAGSSDPALALSEAVVQVRFEVAAGSADWRALAERIQAIAARARAVGQLLDWRDAELARVQALQKAHDPSAGAQLTALVEDARAKGDLVIVQTGARRSSPRLAL